jgi:alpha-tubulin suppressor-like RCC1 family protein
VAVSGLSQDVATVSVGDGFACAITDVGEAKCWGYGGESNLGDGGTADQPVPVDVVGLSGPVQSVLAGNAFACALTDAGAVECWGVNVNGQLGFGSVVAGSDVPVLVTGLSTLVTSLSVGEASACAVTAAGGVVCWGADGHGQLGDGQGSDRFTPTPATGLGSGVTSVGPGVADSSCAVLAAGGLRCWGRDQFEQLGDGGTADQSVPTVVVGFS